MLDLLIGYLLAERILMDEFDVAAANVSEDIKTSPPSSSFKAMFIAPCNTEISLPPILGASF